MKINGKPITSCQRATWDPDDSHDLRASVVIGRARVELDDGEVVHALIVSSTKERTLGRRYAVVFDVSSLRFVAFSMPGQEEV